MEKDKNSLIILFAINDRQNRVRTGKVVKEKLTDVKLTQYLENIKPLLKIGKYTEAISELVDSIFNNLTGNNKLEILYEKLIIFGIVLLVLGIFIYYLVSCLTERTITSKLDKIKNITKSNISRDVFIDLNCTICLEAFKQEDLQELKDKKIPKEKNSINNENNHDIITEINEEVRDRNKSTLNIEDEKKINENFEKDEGFIAKLNCGHIFHSECIVHWMEKQNKCPLCKKDLDDTLHPGNEKKLRTLIVLWRN